MIKQILLENFNKNTTGKKLISGKRVYNNDLVSNIDIAIKNEIININSKVISENFFSEYISKIEIDNRSKEILSTYCTCIDYEKNEFKKNNYFCKHLVAVFYKFIYDLENNKDILNKLDVYVKNSSVFKKDTNGILDLLLKDRSDFKEIKFEVYINRQVWSNKILVEFKIGLKGMNSSKLYVLKDINQFLTCYENKIPIKYGKDFTFDINNQILNTKDLRIIDFILQVKSLELSNSSFIRRQDKYIDGKTLIIPKYMVRQFFEIVKIHRVYLNEGFFYRPIETEILFDSPALDFNLKNINDEYIFSILSGLPEVLSDNKDVFLYGSNIYLPNYDYCYKIQNYLNIFDKVKSITFNKNDEIRILTKLIPEISLLSSNISLSKNIKNKIVTEDVVFNFYFDKINNNITLILKVLYGKY
ncbi:hypothetical protein JCM1393_27160 [Clostridium carnis]